MSGFLSLANTIMRNNKRKRIDKLGRVERYIDTKSTKAEYKEASEYTLSKVRDQVQKQQRESRHNTILIFTIVGILLVIVMCYFLFFY
ncbi:hypothetical protein [Kordia sp.]|uniref:hypothetical protein n=1 Tax=Kordia sp. TaxID=1965332 RepID=UPI003B5BBF24